MARAVTIQQRVLAILATAFLIALSFYLSEISDNSFLYDENSYVSAGKSLANLGLFGAWKFSNLRTYVFPGVLSLLIRLHSLLDPTLTNLRLTIFVFNFLAIASSALFFASVTSKYLKLSITSIFGFILLNPFLLICAPYAITECLSIALCLTAIAAAIHSSQKPEYLLFAGCCLGLAIECRPANIALIPPVAFLSAYAIWSLKVRREDKSKATALFVVSLLLALLPQLLINHLHYQTLSFLPSFSLGGQHLEDGKRMLKYATYVGQPDEAPQIFFFNPFNPAPEPYGYFRQFVAATVKVLCMFDQNFPVPYARSLTPWYRWPGSFLSNAILVFGMIGVLRSFWTSKMTKERIVAAGILIAVCSFCMLHSVSVIECRFGIFPILLLTLFTLRGFRFSYLRPRLFIPTLILLAFSLKLSRYVEYQAPRLKEAIELSS